jgi:hypothetical protein
VVGDVRLEVHPEVLVRMAALAAASTIHHGTVGTLLSHAADCERWLLEGRL